MSFSAAFVTQAEYTEWRPLFDGYADFYGVTMDDSVAERLWSWLLDPAHVLEGILLRDAQGKAIALAHIRACPRPLAASEIGFLDDLFVSPEARGSGAADALFERLRELATERGWPAIRWVTQDFNERGRAFYDRYTKGPTDFLMYQWKIS